MARLLTNQRGGQKLIYDGYGYVKNSIYRDTIWWQCDVKKRVKCSVTAKTAVDVQDGGYVEVVGKHSHEPNPSKYEIVQAKNALKRKTLETVAPARDIVTEIIGEVGEQVAAQLPRADSLRRLVQRYRQERIQKEQGGNKKEPRPAGLDPNLRPIVIDIYNSGTRLPKSILFWLRARGYPEPPLNVLSNFLKIYRKKLKKNAPPGEGGNVTVEGAAPGTAAPRRPARQRRQQAPPPAVQAWDNMDVGGYEETGETATAVSQILTTALDRSAFQPGTTVAGVLTQGPQIRGPKAPRTSRLIPPYSLSGGGPGKDANANANASLMKQVAELKNVAANLSKTLEETNKAKSRWVSFGDYIGKALEALPQDTAWIVSRDMQELLFQAQAEASTSQVDIV